MVKPQGEQAGNMAGANPWTALVRRSVPGLLPMGSRQAGHDLIAALALAAVAVPEQMATARLAGEPAAAGLLVFVAASLGFYLLGSSRSLSVGADSTIAPIFAGTLAILATPGSAHYLTLASVLAFLVGGAVGLSGVLRMGWIARLLSIPVITGFLAGIAVHIAISQLPELFGIVGAPGGFLGGVVAPHHQFALPNPLTIAIGAAVFALTYICEKIDIRIPGALIAMALVSIAANLFGWTGVTVLGIAKFGGMKVALPHTSFFEILTLAPLALIISLAVIIQSAATTRSFQNVRSAPDINHDLIGVGFSNILSGLLGGFPVNASPPRTAIVAESGGVSRFSGLLAGVLVAAVLWFGLPLLAHVPVAALAGLLLFVAMRIFRVETIVAIAAQSRAEFALLLVTAISIVVAPIEVGVGIGVILSILHGVWTISQTRAVTFEQMADSTVWWPANRDFRGRTIAGIVVVGFQAPLFFLNADTFRKTLREAVLAAPQPVRSIVLEASNIVEIDFSGAQILADVVQRWKDEGIDFYIARLESLRARDALTRFGLLNLIGQKHVVPSVDDAIQHISLRPAKE